MTQLKPNTKPLVRLGILLGVLGVSGAGVYFGGKYFAPTMESVVPTAGEDVTFSANDLKSATGVARIELTEDNSAASKRGEEIRNFTIEWNANFASNGANGGITTQPGSLMERAGVKYKPVRTDKAADQGAALIACANEMKENDANNCPTKGAQMITIMGDGAANVITTLTRGAFSKLPPDLRPIMIPWVGRSAGEDGYYGPPEWQTDPELARGKLSVAGSVKDGDWDTAQSWLSKNGLCNNPDWTTYDPDCMNWMNVDDFVQADQAFNAKACETRPVVKKGKRTGDSKRVCVEAVATWFPGDEVVVTGRGGIVPLLTTRENSGQMPAVVITIERWYKAHLPQVTAMYKASFVAAALMTEDPSVMQDYGRASAEIWGEENAAFWIRGYRGFKAQDVNGMEVQLGGSESFTYATALRFYGLDDEGTNTFANTYVKYGNIVVEQYPQDLPSYIPFNEVYDATALKALANDSSIPRGKAVVPTIVATTQSPRVSDRDWNIQFASNSSTFTGASTKVLEELLSELIDSENTAVEIHGYTDSQGEDQPNLVLSQARADAVRDWLTQHGGEKVGNSRFILVNGHGESEADQKRVSAADRRVQIVLRSNVTARN